MARETMASLRQDLNALREEFEQFKTQRNTRQPRQSGPNRNEGRPATDNQKTALTKLGDGEEFMVDFLTASKRLDEWQATFKAYGIRIFRCSYCDKGVHNTAAEAQACALASAAS